MQIKTIYDLTATLETYMPIWPDNAPVDIHPDATVARDGSKIETIRTATHAGTHMDAPSHMVEDGRDIDQVSLNRIVGEGYVIRPEIDGTEISRKSIESVWKDEYKGKIVLINTGWDRKRAFTREFQFDFPGLSMGAAEFLSEHLPSVIGIDTLGIEPYDHKDFRVHKALLRHDLVFIEDMAGLDQLSEGKKYLIAALPLKLGGASGSMARVIAMDVE